MKRMMLFVLSVLLFVLATTLPGGSGAQRRKTVRKQYDTNPFVFTLAQPRPDERAGGIVAVDVNNDGLLDYLYTTPGSVGAYDHFGKTLWVKQVDIHLLGADGVVGLHGIHGPGVQAADVDGDGMTEVLLITRVNPSNCWRRRSGTKRAMFASLTR